jgi:hypothetical protein
MAVLVKVAGNTYVSGSGLNKCPTVYREDKNGLSPVFYVRKAKNATKEDWDNCLGAFFYLSND